MVGKTIGVLALQGAFHEHETSLKKCGAKTVQVRKTTDLDRIQGLIIPGGESTTVAKLMIDYGLKDKIIEKSSEHMPIWGTCAGMILMAKEIVDSDQPRLGLMDILVRRNAYGRQVDSFETDLVIEPIGTVKGVFIRAPYVERVFDQAEVMCMYQGKIVMVKQGANLLATAFHPELTISVDIHKYFLEMI